MLSLDNIEVYEVILGDGFLMSSLFTEVETALARLGLAALEADAGDENAPEPKWDVIVGGLGLGYTARAALAHPGVRSLAVVETLQPVIDWHRKGLVPLGPELTGDPRCRFVHGDFFALAMADGFDPENPGRKVHAVLLDIDHSPRNLLHEKNGAFYSTEGLRRFSENLHPGGIFGLWSDDPPDDEFLRSLEEVFPACETHVVTFDNPVRGGESSSTVYIARVSY